MNTDSQHVWDAQADTYTTRFDGNYTQFLKYELIARHARPDDRALDVGVANGVLALPAASLVDKVVGIDISPAMLVQARANADAAGIDNVELVRASATALPFDTASFDLAWSYSMLLLLPDPMQAIGEIARVLKPDGTAILDLCGSFNLSWMYWSLYYLRQGHHGLAHFRLGRARAALNHLGLDVVECHATGLLDQWKYVPGVRRLAALDRFAHEIPTRPDRDYRYSNRLPALANRWYFVVRKRRGA